MPSTLPLNTADWTHWGQRTRVSPFPTIISMETMCKELQEYVGTTLTRMIVVFENGVVHYLLHHNDRTRCAGEILARLRSEPLLYRRLTELTQSIGKHLVSVAHDVGEHVSPLCSDQTLLGLYQQYEHAYRPVYASYGSVWVVEDVLREAILEFVRARLGNHERAIEAVNRITIEPSTHIASQEEESIIRFALTISETPSWQDQFPAQSLESLSIDIQERIQQHLHRFFWVSRDYEDAVMTATTVLERLHEALNKSPRRQAQELADRKTAWRSQREQTLAMLSLSPREMSMVEAMHDITILKAQRKQFVSKSLFWFDPVLHEIARRLGCSMTDVRFLTRQDIEEALLGGGHEKLWEHRITQCAWHVDREGATLIPAEDLERVRSLIHPDVGATDSITGLGVSPGRARGRVRIVLYPQELAAIEDGDIVVSIQLQPNVGTILYRAAALVCDGGHGITSHPATLAREAGIPAVIQTRNARNIFQNGDLVEVDGYAGTVKRVK